MCVCVFSQMTFSWRTRRGTRWMTLRSQRGRRVVSQKTVCSVLCTLTNQSFCFYTLRFTLSASLPVFIVLPVLNLFHYCVLCPCAVRIRSRLKKLMARRPQLETLKTKGILEGEHQQCIHSFRHYGLCTVWSTTLHCTIHVCVVIVVTVF